MRREAASVWNGIENKGDITGDVIPQDGLDGFLPFTRAQGLHQSMKCHRWFCRGGAPLRDSRWCQKPGGGLLTNKQRSATPWRAAQSYPLGSLYDGMMAFRVTA
jgi:hypothetical protein